MTIFMTRRRTVGRVAGAGTPALMLLLLSGALQTVQAQAPEAPAVLEAPADAPAKPLRIDSVGHAVKDLLKTVEFYQEAFHLKPVSPPSGWQKTASNNDRAAQVSSRSATLALPGTETTLTLVEFKGAPRHSIHPRNSDPGASTLAFTVKDVDGTFRQAVAAGATVVTKGGEPMALGPAMRLVFVTDPDGFFIEIGGDPRSDVPGSPENITSVRAGFTIGDSDKAGQFYRKVLGMRYQPPKDFTGGKPMANLVGVEDIQFKASFATLSESAVRLEFLEFRGVESAPRWGAPQDPGMPWLVLTVKDLDGAARAILSAGGKHWVGSVPAVTAKQGVRFLKDPNGLPLEILAQH